MKSAAVFYWTVKRTKLTSTIVTARHREEIEMLQRLWIATIEEIKLKKEKKTRKRFAVECEVIETVVCCQDRAVFRVRQELFVG